MPQPHGPLTAREQVVLAIVLIQEGERASRTLITNVVLAQRGPFGNLSPNYIRSKAINSAISSLVNRGYLSAEGDDVQALGPGKDAVSLLHAPLLLEIGRGVARHSRYNTVSVDISESRETLKHFSKVYPEDLVSEILQALDLYQRTDIYDMVIVKCWRCVEILLFAVNDGFRLTRERRASDLLRRFGEKQIQHRIPTEKGTRDAFEAFVSAAVAIYSFRSKMAAHWARDWWWGKREIAAAVLVLTLHLIDLFVLRIVPRLVVVPAHERKAPGAHK